MYLLVIVGAVTFAVVGNARAKSLAQHTAERLLLAAPADFVDGAYVRVEGVIEATDLGLAPADATRYVALRLYVRVDGHWRVSTDLRPFVLRTEHGPIVVERQAEVALAMRPQFKGSLKRLPARYLPSEVRLRKLRSLHCEQTIVTPGMRVWVAGVVLLEPAPPTSRLGFRDTNQTVRLLSHAEHLLTIGEVPR